MRGPEAQYWIMDELYREALSFLVDGPTFPVDFPAITPLPWNTPDTKEVNAVVAKHLPNEPKTDRRPRESWIKRWFGQPEVNYIKLEPGQEPPSAALVPPGTSIPAPAIRPAVLRAEPEPEQPSIISELTDRAVQHSVRAHNEGIIDGLQLAMDHISVLRSKMDIANFAGEVRHQALTDAISAITIVRERALEITAAGN